MLAVPYITGFVTHLVFSYTDIMTFVFFGRLALTNSLKRGWLSYTDLTSLLQSNKMTNHFKGVGVLLVQVSFTAKAINFYPKT